VHDLLWDLQQHQQQRSKSGYCVDNGIGSTLAATPARATALTSLVLGLAQHEIRARPMPHYNDGCVGAAADVSGSATAEPGTEVLWAEEQ